MSSFLQNLIQRPACTPAGPQELIQSLDLLHDSSYAFGHSGTSKVSKSKHMYGLTVPAVIHQTDSPY